MYDDLNRGFGDADGMPREERLDALMQSGQLDEALAILEDWHEGEPWNGEVLVRMAVVHWLAGEPARTLRDLDAFLAMDPDNAEVLARRAQALLTLGKRADAEVTLARAETLDPTSPGVLLNKGLLLEDQGDLPGAVTALSGYLAQIPQDHLALARRSSLFRQQGDYQSALSDALACVQLQPGDPESHFAEALARITMEQGPEALAACETCLTLQPQFLPALRLKVDLLADLGQVDDAEVALTRLLLVDAAGNHTALLQARVATERGDYTTALEWANRFLDDSPDEPYGYFRRGMIYERMEQYETAIADFEEYARMAPHALEAYEQQFLCDLGLERYEDAAAVSKDVLERAPQNYRLQYNYGFAELLCGRIASAKAHFLTTLQLAPQNEEVVLRVHLVLSEYASASELRAWLSEAMAIAGISPLVKGLLAESLIGMGEYQAAFAHAQEILHTDPSRPFAYLLSVKALCLLDRYPEALTVADAGIAALPEDGRVRLARALVLRDLGQPDEALAELAVAERLLPGDAEVVRQQALVFGSVGDTDAAIRLLQQALMLDTTSADSHFWLSYFLLHRQQYLEALHAADTMLAVEAESAEGHLVRGAALNGLERWEEGNAELAVVKQHNPELLARIVADPVIAALIDPQQRDGVIDRMRRSVSRWRTSRRRAA